MPPKKGQAKKKRVPHANETPLKDKQPGHGAVERAKNQMWSSSSSSSSSVQTTSSTGSAVQQAPSAVARPKYKATSTIIGMGGVGIGRGGGGGGGIKKKKAASSAAGATMKNTTTSTVGSQRTAVGRSNPDADFFGGPPLWSTI
eukprot:scaffold17060_cov80-Skeletonema_marinoi.AAC.1